MNAMDTETKLIVLCIFGAYILVPLFVVCMWVLMFLCDKRRRFDFLCDMEEYEYCKCHGLIIPHYLNHGEFLFAVKIYHKLYGQRRFPKPENEQEKQ